MSKIDYIRNSLQQFAEVFEDGERFAVPTQCLYPSNDCVVVYVYGGENECVVSDGGGALDEISSHGITVENPMKLLKQFSIGRGIITNGQKVFTNRVPWEALVSAIVLVANASAEAANWAVDNMKPKVRRNIKSALLSTLCLYYSRDRIKTDERLTGKSARSYRFDNVVMIGEGKKLLVDAVIPEPGSVNARVVAHLDVSRNEDSNVIQRIVYDDDDKWSSADLNILQMAAELVPLTRAAMNFDRLSSGIRLPG